MIVEILRTLKGEKIWNKGTVFNDAVSLIPRDVLNEVRAGTNSVKVLMETAEITNAVSEVEPEIIETENPAPEGLHELEGLIKFYGNRNKVATKLGVRYYVIVNWLNKGISDPDTISKIKRIYDETINDQ